jgi:hypothetical protein
MHTPLLSASLAAQRLLVLGLTLGLAGAAQAHDNGEVAPSTSSVVGTDLTISTGTSASPVVIPGGTYDNIIITGTGVAVLGGTVTVNASLVVQSGGELQDGDSNNYVSGPGTITVAAGAKLVITSVAGIWNYPGSNSSAGVFRGTGARSYASDATYVYASNNASFDQGTGDGLPAVVRSLEMRVPASRKLTLGKAVSIRQTLRLVSGTLSTGTFVVYPLTLLSDASGTALLVNAGGTVTGNVTVQRYIDPSTNAGTGYRHIAAPTQGQTIASLGSGGTAPVLNSAYNSSANPTAVTPFPSVFRYDQARLITSPATTLSAFDRGWIAPSTPGESMPLALGGYTVQLPGASTLSFTGALAQGQGAIAMSRNTGATAADAGWNFVGNPYASPLDVSTVQASQRINVDAAYYVFESTSQYSGQYRSYVNGFGNPIIGTAQAFFMRVSSGQTSGSVTFTNANRVTDYNQPAPVRRGNDPRPQLTLALSGQGLSDVLTVYAEAGATDAADAEFDALKLPNTTGLNLAAVASNGQELAIDGRPALGPATLIPLAVQVPRAGTYTFTADQVANLPAGLTLVDQLTGTRTPLTTGRTYAAQLSATPAPGRFWLETGSRVTANAAAQAQQQVQLYPNPSSGQLTLLRPAHWGSTAVEVLNGVGQVVLRRVLPATETQLNVQTLPAGVYQLRLTTPQGAVTKRLVRQ